MADTEYRNKQEETVAAIKELSKLLDDMHRILKGDTDTPGALRRICELEKSINGESRELGIAMKVKILWSTFGLALAAVGYALHPYLSKLAKLLP